jgi:hypothetical protein
MTLLRIFVFYSMPISTAIALFIILGLIWVYTSGNETKKLRENLNYVYVTIGLVVLGAVAWSYYDERVNTPNYVVEGEIGKWDWKNTGTSYFADGEKMNISIYKSEIDSLPEPQKLKEMFDKTIQDLSDKNKGFKLKTGTFSYEYNSQYSYIDNIPQHTLDLMVRYSSEEGADDWVWDGNTYVKKKIPSDKMVKVFKFNNQTLELVKVTDKI